MRIKIYKKPGISRQKMYDFLVGHIGELFILGFMLFFALGFFVFWKFAWNVSNFQPTARVNIQKIPQKSLEESEEYIRIREAAFSNYLPALNMRDPFTENVQPPLFLPENQ